MSTSIPAVDPIGIPIPTWLETHANAIPPPPVTTKFQSLPFEDLTWENFERLCLRYIRLQASVEFCQAYGLKGQDQEGIDFYARLNQPIRYAVYQCKRIESLEPSDITNAVTTFLAGTWSHTASFFVLCLSQSTTDTKFTKVIEKETERLRERKIDLGILDQERLSEQLKPHPHLVDDFFGRPWTRVFCGEDVESTLSKRLGGEVVLEYCQKLADFYRFLFVRHDPAIPVRAQIGSPDIDPVSRFVVPDVFASLPIPAERQIADTGHIGKFNPERGSVDPPVGPQIQLGRSLRTRTALDIWLSKADRSVILGVPGSGKSALLRFLALDLLSPCPSLSRVATRLGDQLPIWVPFAFWTNLNSKSKTPVSLRECLQIWFRQFDQDTLWKLVEMALEDQRLLLFVDGLDEWDSEVAARTTSNLLQSFVQEHNLAAILVSRPYGFERVGIQGADWQSGELAPLSPEQQHDLALKWLQIRHERINPEPKIPSDAVSTGAIRDCEEFSRSLAKSADLSQLAETPLLLLLLLYLYIENTPLPDSRFAAYDYVINHFVREHPLGKRTAASLTSEQDALNGEEIRNAMAFLAAIVQEQFPTGVLAENEIRPLLESFLKDEGLGLGLSSNETRHVLKYFTNLEEGSLGLLVSQGHGNLSFFHRSLQEFLASVHFARQPLDVQKAALKQHLPDSRWHEVLLGIIWLCRRNSDAETFAQVLEETQLEPADESARYEVLANVAFGDFRLSPSRARDLAEVVCNQIERSQLSSHRARLLTQVLAGLGSKKTRQIAQQRLRRWIFARPSRWQMGASLSLWPPDDLTWSVLCRALYDEELFMKRGAGNAISIVFKGDLQKTDLIARLALSSPDYQQRAVALVCLADGWPDYAGIKEAFGSAVRSSGLDLKLAGISTKVKLGLQDGDDLSEMMKLARSRFHGGLDYWWRDEAIRSLVKGWQGNALLKKSCLKGARKGYAQSDGMDSELSETVVVNAFPQDAEVAHFIAARLGQPHPFEMQAGVWEALPRNFRSNEMVVQALDEWVGKLEKQHIRQVEVSYAALVGRTEAMKNKLLDSIDGWVPFWAVRSLLEGWGMADAAVSEHLQKAALSERASEIAHYIPAILDNPREARNRLVALLHDPSSRRLDLIVDGLSRLSDRGDEEEIVAICLDRLRSDTTISFKDMFLHSLIVTFKNHQSIRSLSLEQLDMREPPLGAIGEAFASDTEIRNRVGEQLTPLSTDLRTQIVSELGSSPDIRFGLELLRQWDSEGNAEVKTLAAMRYNSALSERGEDTDHSLTQLAGMFPCYGPDHQERRQAALAGLLTLGALDTVKDKVESIGFEGKPVVVELSHGSKSNRVLLECIGKHWEYVKKSLQGDFPRLFLRTGQPAEFWEEIALVGADYPSLARDILQECDQQPHLFLASNVLAMIARLDPHSERLLDSCLRVLAGNTPRYKWFDDSETASSLLADQFRGDPGVENRLLGLIRREEWVPTGVLMALCKGWPDSELLAHWQNDSEASDRFQEAGVLYPKYATAKRAAMGALLESDLRWAELDRLHATGLVRPVMARIRNDSLVTAHLFDYLTQSSNPTVKATFSACIAASGPLTPEQASWYREEIARQSRLESPDFGFDLLSQSQRAITVCLIESLSARTADSALTM